MSRTIDRFMAIEKRLPSNNESDVCSVIKYLLPGELVSSIRLLILGQKNARQDFSVDRLFESR